MNIEEYAKKHRHLLLDQIPDELDLIIRNNKFTNIIDVGCGGGLFLYSLFKREYEKGFALMNEGSCGKVILNWEK